MYSCTHIKEKILPEELDDYLSKGWYRMVHTIFAANILRREGQLVNAIWLRHPLHSWQPGTTFKKLARRNASFRIEFGPLEITASHEALYSIYRNYKFEDDQADLRQSLFGPETSNPFDSWVVNCYDGDKLIAAGIFDKGIKTAAGIVSFFDPAYEKFSLGTYLIYQKMIFCKSQGLEYFYPGYILTGVPEFDYKLSIGRNSTEYFQLASGKWLPWSDFTKEEWNLENMVLHLEKTKEELEAKGKFAKLVYYDPFDITFYSQYAGQFWDCPVYLNLGVVEGYETELIVKYDIKSRQNQFYLTELTTEEDYVIRDGKTYCVVLQWFDRVNQ
ncbi:MAG: hypothetical protein IPP79_05125 [Chitinophagaceae bacterium]|nr:hypothetical protein [Chitinophagaceae bacterium]